MSEKVLRELKIDQTFKNLIRPLLRQEYLQLEENILSYGCREPIAVWCDTILDGHNRYEICMKHQVPFSVLELEFTYREEAVAWICANQLGRRNLTEEARKYLIGKQYESEKVANDKRNALGINQYSRRFSLNGDAEEENTIQITHRRTAARIAEENHISHGSVQKYSSYARAIEAIGCKVPEMVPKLLSGRYKVSHKNIIELARMDAEDIKKVCNRIEKNQLPFVRYNTTRREIQKTTANYVPTELQEGPSVKDMPKYDPDAEITGLILTIPSWISSIQRILNMSDMSGISESARVNLLENLDGLQDKISEIAARIEAVK